jgi:hypothetical protein
MGDAGLVKEQLLIAFMHDLPAAVLEDIRAKFPTAEITIIHLERMAPIPSGSSCTHSIDNEYADSSLRVCAEGYHYCHFHQSAEY